jgi:hypothetical protein
VREAQSLDGAIEDNQLLPEQGVFGHQLRFTPCHVHDRAADECGQVGFVQRETCGAECLNCEPFEPLEAVYSLTSIHVPS